MNIFPKKDWECPNCTFINTDSYDLCELCGYEPETYQFDIPIDVLDTASRYKNNNKMSKFLSFFNKKYVLLPVIHVKDLEQVLKNCELCFECGTDGVWLINHNVDSSELVRIIKDVRNIYPEKWIGANFVDLYAHEAFDVINETGIKLDGLWVDNAMINEDSTFQKTAEFLNCVRFKNSWNGLYFGSIAFKYKAQPKNLKTLAKKAYPFMDVVTTSGTGNGNEMPVKKAQDIFDSVMGTPIAIASGVTHQNIQKYSKYVNCFMVSSCIESDFFNFDRQKLIDLVSIVRLLNFPQT